MTEVVQEALFAYVSDMGIKQKTIAENCGMTEMSVSSVARGERRLTAEEFCSICAFLGLSMDTFRNTDG